MDYEIEIRNLKEEDKIFPAGPLGNFSLAGFEMTLERHFTSYIITYYLPSGLFVVVSWISFLIPPDIVPGRMALLITLFLVLVNIFNNINPNPNPNPNPSPNPNPNPNPIPYSNPNPYPYPYP